MMNLLKHIGIVVVLAFVMEQFLPWWSIAIAAGLAGVAFSGHLGRSFLGGFLGVALLWLVLALMMSAGSDSDLPAKFAQLLPGGLGPTALLLITAVVGGLVGGFASMSGDALRSGFFSKN
ncbi:MAG: hypothetical protein AAF570_05065 [Bacteroidota bacterium]